MRSTVRHTPSTLTEAPNSAVKPDSAGAIASRTAGPSAASSRRIPVVSIIPVNRIYLVSGIPVIMVSLPNCMVSTRASIMHLESARGLSNPIALNPPPRILFA